MFAVSLSRKSVKMLSSQTVWLRFCCKVYQWIVNGQVEVTEVQKVLGLHEFGPEVQAKFTLVKLCTSSLVKLCASEIVSTCYPRNGLCLKIRASEIHTSDICTSEIGASQGPLLI